MRYAIVMNQKHQHRVFGTTQLSKVNLSEVAVIIDLQDKLYTVYETSVSLENIGKVTRKEHLLWLPIQHLSTVSVNTNSFYVVMSDLRVLDALESPEKRYDSIVWLTGSMYSTDKEFSSHNLKRIEEYSIREHAAEKTN